MTYVTVASVSRLQMNTLPWIINRNEKTSLISPLLHWIRPSLNVPDVANVAVLSISRLQMNTLSWIVHAYNNDFHDGRLGI